jgi:hypothetical protein
MPEEYISEVSIFPPNYKIETIPILKRLLISKRRKI